jgi:hypothetical protein
MSISATGNLSLSDKFTNYDNIANFILDGRKIIKFYFSDNKFYYLVGSDIKHTLTNTRTNFLDYVFSGIAPIPFLFSSTLKEASYNGSSWTDGDLENEGTTYTSIEEIVITTNSAVTAGDTIAINSANDSGITYTFKDDYLSGHVFTIKLIRNKKLAGGIFTTQYFEMFDNAGNKQNKAKSSGKDYLELTLEAGARIDTFTISVNGFTYSSLVMKFRDAFRSG